MTTLPAPELPPARPLPLRRQPAGVISLTRLLPPACDEACDPVPFVAIQGELALGLDQTPELPARPEPTLLPTTSDGLDGFVARLAQAIVEVIGGDRGVHQLMRWTTEHVYDDLVERVNALQRVAPGEQRVRRVRAQVRSVRLFRPRPGVAELSVHVRHGERSRAIAARLELIERRWRCTVLDFG